MFTSLLLSGVLSFSMQAQNFHMPAASPSVHINQEFSTSQIELKYSRPAVNDRSIFGDMIPYGEVWRTGANQVTKITFGEKVSFGGQMVEAGTYALYTIPGEKEWEVILNMGLDNWGADGYSAKEDVTRIKVPAHKTKEMQESFSLNLENVGKDSAELVLAWENTKISIPVKADNHQRIMGYLDKKMEGDNPPYFQAASYYLSTNEKLETAYIYVQKAIDENPKAYYMYWAQAQILEKLGKNKKAIASAKKAAQLAKDNSPTFAYEYQNKYEKMLEKLRK